jgi:hypothetical protein
MFTKVYTIRLGDRISELYLGMAKSIVKDLDCLETKGKVAIALASAYWNRDNILHKLFGLLLVVKGLMMMSPWQNANGRIVMKQTISVLNKSAQVLLMSAIKNMKNFLKV